MSPSIQNQTKLFITGECAGFYPGIPPASILLATVTSVDHTSYCQRFCPSTPPRTVPECTPTRMSTSVCVFSRTYLKSRRMCQTSSYSSTPKSSYLTIIIMKQSLIPMNTPEQFSMHHSRNGLNHGQTHHDGAGRMIIAVVWKATNTVIAVAQNLDPQLVVFLKVEHLSQLQTSEQQCVHFFQLPCFRV